jgi:nucleoside-triphosphatase THEP1
MNLHNIYILCDAIHSGKSTLLLQFCKKYKSVAGFIGIDINALRYLINLEMGMTYPFQKLKSDSEQDVIIGKYIFDVFGFNKAKTILQTMHLCKKEIIIIDEIGKLELDGIGLEPTLSEFMKQIDLYNDKTIILVIRDYLLEQCIAKYNLQYATVLNLQTFKTHFAL